MEPVEVYHAQKRALLEPGPGSPGYAALWARYGPGGTWEHDRKALLAELLLTYKLDPPTEWVGKVTDKVLDALAHNDPVYHTFLDDTRAGREAYIRLHFEVANLDQLALRDHAHLKGAIAESYTT